MLHEIVQQTFVPSHVNKKQEKLSFLFFFFWLAVKPRNVRFALMRDITSDRRRTEHLARVLTFSQLLYIWV